MPSCSADRRHGNGRHFVEQPLRAAFTVARRASGAAGLVIAEFYERPGLSLLSSTSGSEWHTKHARLNRGKNEAEALAVGPGDGSKVLVDSIWFLVLVNFTRSPGLDQLQVESSLTRKNAEFYERHDVLDIFKLFKTELEQTKAFKSLRHRALG